MDGICKTSRSDGWYLQNIAFWRLFGTSDRVITSLFTRNALTSPSVDLSQSVRMVNTYLVVVGKDFEREFQEWTLWFSVRDKNVITSWPSAMLLQPLQ